MEQVSGMDGGPGKVIADGEQQRLVPLSRSRLLGNSWSRTEERKEKSSNRYVGFLPTIPKYWGALSFHH